MKRTNWIAVLSAVLAVISGTATYAAGVKPTDRPLWLTTYALKYQPYALAVGVASVLAIALLQAIQTTWGKPAFRKVAVTDVLDVLVSECTGLPKKNRITIFKKVRGWRALCIGMWRLRWRWWRVEKRAKLNALWRMDWSADYLYVWARSSRARRQRSTTTMRVSDRTSECEGMAGYAWEKSFFVKHNLPVLTPRDQGRIKTMSWEALCTLPPQHPLRTYIDQSNIKCIEQLRAVETFSRHFVGHIIRTPDGDWGVLLLDSEEEVCPFSEDEDGGAFGRVFQTHAEALGNILRGG